jgi:vancomycin resistance protein YoaR
VGRKGTHQEKAIQKVNAITQKTDLGLPFTLNQESLATSLNELAGETNHPATEPTVTIEKGEVIINKGTEGVEIDKEELLKRIDYAIKYNTTGEVEIPLKKIGSKLTDQEAEEIGVRARKILGKTLHLTSGYQTFLYKDQEIITLLTNQGIKESALDGLTEQIVNAVNTPPQNARLIFEEGKVKEFTPGKPGLETEKSNLKNQIKASIETLVVTDEKKAEIEIPTKKTNPEVATGDINNLGLRELIGRGTSRFAGSIPSRIHNVTLAASRINGTLIKPGETFSFNRALGDVSAYTGFQQAYVIKDGKTVLGDGGGVCQVSTTLFRAALNSGLPIEERRAHSYRVGYYEQDSKPGLDATVYDPTTDLKIKNDTPGHILIQTTVNKKTASLAIEFYGTSDGRVATVSIPRVWDITPAPPPSYQDDPTLPAGTIKQIDYAAGGAKAAFDYEVTRDGQTLQKRTFYSNYRPWQAKFLRGTGGQ